MHKIMHYVTQGRQRPAEKRLAEKGSISSLRLEPAEKNFRASLGPKARSSQARALTPRPRSLPIIPYLPSYYIYLDAALLDHRY